MSRVLLVSLAVLLVAGQVIAQSWSYTSTFGPSSWHNSFPECGGVFQSPIDISTIQTTPTPAGFLRLESSVGASSIRTFVNDGTALVVNNPLGEPMMVSGDVWEALHFKQARVHTPSEHTVDGERFDAELQLLFVNRDEQAAGVNTRLVISMLFSTSSDNGAASALLEQFSRNAGNLVNAASTLDSTFSMAFVKRAFAHEFYEYKGSLSVPPCTEGVTWLVNSHIWTISQAQVDALKSTIASSGGSNIRPVQPVNNRDVRHRSYYSKT